MENKRKIGFEIKTLSNLIKRRVENSSTVSEIDKLTGMHGWIIGYLYNNSTKREIFQRDIETEFSIRRSTVTGILQLMEKNGLIERNPVSYDARLKKLVLTPKAIEIHKKVHNEIMEIETRLMKGLSEEEVNTFLTILEKIKKNVE